MIGLYADRELNTPLLRKTIDEKPCWVLNFRHMDAGAEREFQIFLYNERACVIEDLEIMVTPFDKEGVTVEVINGKVPWLGMADIHEFSVRWHISEDVKAGECHVTLSIKGIITEEK